MILRKAVEYSRGQAPEIRSGKLAEKLSGYASILAAQGSLETALKYLGDSSEVSPIICRPPDKRAYSKNQLSYFSIKTCVVGTQKNRLSETVLLNTHNTCLN